MECRFHASPLTKNGPARVADYAARNNLGPVSSPIFAGTAWWSQMYQKPPAFLLVVFADGC
jgi:hypothetical protein